MPVFTTFEADPLTSCEDSNAVNSFCVVYDTECLAKSCADPYARVEFGFGDDSFGCPVKRRVPWVSLRIPGPRLRIRIADGLRRDQAVRVLGTAYRS